MSRSSSNYFQGIFPQTCTKHRRIFGYIEMFLVLKTVDIIKFAIDAMCTIGPYNVNVIELLKYRRSEE